MLHVLPPFLLGPLALVLYIANTLLWCIPIYALALIKLLVPAPGWQQGCLRWLIRSAEGWIRGTLLIMGLTQKIDWDIRGTEGLSRRDWQLVVANHQSWVDILVLLKALGGRIAFPKFFTKHELIWLPLLGVALWALEFPLMRRYSRRVQEQRPELRGRDRETARRACERHRELPVSIVNFLEGTRFTAAKHADQDSPYRHLLRPKVGGVALALTALGDKIKSIRDVSIVYPDGPPSFWDFLCGRLDRVRVRVRTVELPPELASGIDSDDPQRRERFHGWIEDLWRDKDDLIDELLRQSGGAG